MRNEVIDLVKKGFYVLPLSKGGKIPTTKHGVTDAENSEDFARREWSEDTQRNVGIACFNLLVIDVDVKNGDGLAELAEMEKELGKLDPKGKVVTPSGGLHLYFRNPNCDISGRTHIEFHGKKTQIDIRVSDQYVVAPPSVFNGQAYRWEIEPDSADELTDLPQKWIDFLPKKGKSKSLDHPIIEVAIAPENVQQVQERCWRALSKDLRPAIQGQGGQRQMFSAMNTIFNYFGLSKQDGYPVLLKYNELCQPPWDMNNPTDARWIDKKIDEAISTATSRGEGLSVERNDDHLPQLAPDFLERSYVDSIEAYEQTIDLIDNVLDPALFDVPGFISTYIQVLSETVIYNNKHTFFSGALALMSLLIGPRFNLEGVYANLYVISLARSGEGKNAPRHLNSYILNNASKETLVGEAVASGEAIEDEILRCGRKLIQKDECDFLFKNLAEGKETFQRSIQEKFLILYSKVDDILPHRLNASMQKNQTFNDVLRWNPYFVFLGTAPPRNYYESLSRRITEGGLFARLLTITAPDGEFRPENKNNYKKHPLCKKLIEFARLLLSLKVEPNEDPLFVGRSCEVPAIELTYTSKAREIIVDFAREADVKKKEAGDDESKRSVYNRAYENAKKLAIIYEISRKMDIIMLCKDEYNELDPGQVRENLIIDEEVVSWAINFIRSLIRLQEKDFHRYYHDNEYAKNNSDIYDFINRGYKHTVLRKNLFQRFSSIPIREMETSLLGLINQGRIKKVLLDDRKGNKIEAYSVIIGD